MRESKISLHNPQEVKEMKTKWYEIYVNDIKYDDVYTEQDIIKTACELVNNYGADPDSIRIVEH